MPHLIRNPRAVGLAVAAFALLLISGAARACECEGGYYSYCYHPRHSYYSCYGGGYDCGYERSYYYPYAGYRRAHHDCGGDGCYTRHYDGSGPRDRAGDDDEN
jgi:hypothetical protein